MDKIDFIQNVSTSFKVKYNNNPAIISTAPGRINLIGEHTDYNNGLAMPIAINRWVTSCLSKSQGSSFSVFSINYGKTVDINPDVSPDTDDQWVKLVSSIIFILSDEYEISTGADIAVEGNIPIGCGLSSSAAFIASISLGILELFDIEISKKKLADLSQKIEKSALGIDCGLLDYYSTIYSKKNCAMIIDFKFDKLDFVAIPKDEFSIIVINSLVYRELANSEYLERVKQCRDGLKVIKRKYDISDFRDLDVKMLDSLKQDKILYNRLKHFIDENQRVRDMQLKLVDDYIAAGKILRTSHDSLKVLYEVSCEEIDYIIDASESFHGWRGGRIIGGGFGGCSIHFVDISMIAEYQHHINNCFRKKYNYELDIFEIKYSSGISIDYRFNNG
jgi:galactokinase